MDLKKTMNQASHFGYTRALHERGGKHVYVLDVNNAIKIAKQYAESKCREQAIMSAEFYVRNTHKQVHNSIQPRTKKEIAELLLKQPLATEQSIKPIGA